MSSLVLLAGGSGGIGSAAARLFAQRGYRPIIGYVENSTTARMVAEQTGGTAIPLDLSDTTSIAAALDAVAAIDGELAGVVLAGSPPPDIAPLFELQPASFEHHFRVNALGTRRLLDGLVRREFRRRRSGWVVAVLTQAMGLNGDASRLMGSYIVGKYALLGLLRALEAEYPWLTVKTVAPGFTETRMLDVFDERFLELVRQSSTSGRFATAEEVAYLIAQEVAPK